VKGFAGTFVAAVAIHVALVAQRFPDVRLEVASVKPNRPDDRSQSAQVQPGGRVVLNNRTRIDADPH